MEILSGLFVNASILIASLTLIQVFVDNNNYRQTKHSDVIVGVLAGVVGSLLIAYSVRIMDNFLFDFRQIPIILVGLHYSRKSSILAYLIIISFRLVYGGFQLSSFIAIVVGILVVVSVMLVSQMKKSYLNKWLYAILAVSIITGINYYLLIQGSLFVNVMVPYVFGLFTLGIITYFLTTYFSHANENYEKVKHESTQDFLTGLMNLREFSFIYDDLRNDQEIRKKQVSILFIDVNDFKQINDTFGHECGDDVLIALSQILKELCVKDKVIAARKGGDEFVILSVDIQPSEVLKLVSEINTKVSNLKILNQEEQTLLVSVSIGIASFPNPVKDINQLLHEADLEMYRVKETFKVQKQH